jgi:hypothetical protein
MSVEEISDTAAALDAMAMTAATTYYENAVKFGIMRYPRTSFRNSRNWSKFMQVARICLNNKIPVEVFVSAAFTRAMERHAFVTANDICMYNADNLRQPKGSTGPCPQDMWNMLSCKLLDMRFALDGVKDSLELLDSSMYGFPAWFRVFAPEKPPQDIIVHWGDLAYEELSDNKALEEYLVKKRPDTYNLLKSVVGKI